MAQQRLALAEGKALLPDVTRRTPQRDLKALVVREVGHYVGSEL